MALVGYEALVCPDCDAWTPESHDPQAADSYKLETVAHCHACEALDRHVREQTERQPGQKFRLLIPASVRARFRGVAGAVTDRATD